MIEVRVDTILRERGGTWKWVNGTVFDKTYDNRIQDALDEYERKTVLAKKMPPDVTPRITLCIRTDKTRSTPPTRPVPPELQYLQKEGWVLCPASVLEALEDN